VVPAASWCRHPAGAKHPALMLPGADPSGASRLWQHRPRRDRQGIPARTPLPRQNPSPLAPPGLRPAPALTPKIRKSCGE
jgi:hypothetical protein